MRFKKFIRSFDVFGEPVSLNYNGESSFKTIIGALFTLLIKIFLTIYVVQNLIGLFAYKDPQISIVSFFGALLIFCCFYYSIRNITHEIPTIP